MGLFTPSKNKLTLNQMLALHVDEHGKPKNSYMCAATGTGGSILLNDSVIALVGEGHGVLVDMPTYDLKKIRESIEDITAKNNKTVFNLDFPKASFNFTYDPFAGKNLEQAMLTAVGLLGIDSITNAGAAHYAATASMYVEAVVMMHFLTHDSLSFNEFINYFCYAERVDEELTKLKSLSNEQNNYSSQLKWADVFYADGYFNRQQFAQSLGGFVGILNMLRIDCKDLFDLTNTDKPQLNFRDAILNRDVILMDCFESKSNEKSVTKYLKNLIAADIQVALAELSEHSVPDRTFTFFISDSSILKTASRYKILECGRLTNVAILHHYFSYDVMQRAPMDYRKVLEGNTHNKIIFNEKHLQVDLGLNNKQLELKNNLSGGEFLLINSDKEKILKAF